MTSNDEDRARRLAEALRDNLRRRKAQARGAPQHAPASDADTDTGTEADPVSPSSRAP